MNTNNQNHREQNSSSSLAYVARDVIAVALLGILLFVIHNFVTPFRRGIHCDDDTIRYPFKESTVSSLVLHSCGALLNIGLIFLLEYQLLRERNSRNSDVAIDSATYGWNVYCRFLVWFFGAISSELLTDISKVSVGRLRPHFLDVCRPFVANQPFDDYCSSAENRYKYVLDYRCTRDNGDLKETRLSFMSGHSSYAAYSATFAVLYLQTALSSSRLGFFKPCIQTLLICVAFYVGLSRISDYKHHWQDVLTGLLQGTTVGVVVSRCLWPAVRKLVPSGIGDGGDQVSQELNRVSY